MKKTVALLTTTFALALSLSGCDISDLTSGTDSQSSTQVDVEFTPKFTASEAKEALKKINVSDTEPATKYERVKNFGKSWADVDDNGCDTRNDILKRDLENVKFGDAASSCPDATVMSGTLVDPYTGKTIDFVRGEGKNQDGGVQIDHVVPLSYAWQEEADTRLTQPEREQLANDPENLIASDGPANGCKSDSGLVKEVSEKTFEKNDSAGCDFQQSDVVKTENGKVFVKMAWLPNESFRCDATQQFIYVLDKYGLDIKPVDKQVAEDILAKC